MYASLGEIGLAAKSLTTAHFDAMANTSRNGKSGYSRVSGTRSGASIPIGMLTAR